jgi:hypothetical protein
MRRYFILFVMLTLFACTRPSEAPAQFVGYVGQQTIAVKVFTNQAAPGVSAITIPNMGTSSHWLTYCNNNANTGSIRIQLEGSQDNVTWFPISHVGTNNAQGCFVLQAAGYFPKLRANLVVLIGVGASIDAFYTGAAGPIPGAFIGDAVQVQGVPFSPPTYGNVLVQSSITASATNTNSQVNAIAPISFTPTDPKTAIAIYHLSAVCSAGTATLRVCSTASPCAAPVFSLPVGTTPLIVPFNSGPLIGLPGTVLTAEVTSCGAGNTGTINEIDGLVLVSQ